MDLFHEDQAAWLAQAEEQIIDPDRPIIDPHHHLWPDMMGDVYNIDELALDCFGVERCMFESNFPVDRLSLAYPVYWNAMKKLTVDCSDAEKDALFAATARRVYRLPA